MTSRRILELAGLRQQAPAFPTASGQAESRRYMGDGANFSSRLNCESMQGEVAGAYVGVEFEFAGAGFFGAAFLLRISEVQDIVDVFRRKVGRSL